LTVVESKVGISAALFLTGSSSDILSIHLRRPEVVDDKINILTIETGVKQEVKGPRREIRKELVIDVSDYRK
jgi:hypothetical protein